MGNDESALHVEDNDNDLLLAAIAMCVVMDFVDEAEDAARALKEAEPVPIKTRRVYDRPDYEKSVWYVMLMDGTASK